LPQVAINLCAGGDLYFGYPNTVINEIQQPIVKEPEKLMPLLVSSF